MLVLRSRQSVLHAVLPQGRPRRARSLIGFVYPQNFGGGQPTHFVEPAPETAMPDSSHRTSRSAGVREIRNTGSHLECRAPGNRPSCECEQPGRSRGSRTGCAGVRLQREGGRHRPGRHSRNRASVPSLPESQAWSRTPSLRHAEEWSAPARPGFGVAPTGQASRDGSPAVVHVCTTPGFDPYTYPPGHGISPQTTPAELKSRRCQKRCRQ